MEILTVKEQMFNGELTGYHINGNIDTLYPVDFGKIAEFVKDGGVIEPFMTEEEQLVHAMREVEIKFVSAIESMIAGEVTRLNTAFGVAMKDIYSCDFYGNRDTYPLQIQCKALADWSADLWEAMRQWQGGLEGIPTEEEFFDELMKHKNTAEY